MVSGSRLLLRKIPCAAKDAPLRVTVVGAGPVGLWFALCLKLAMPSARVVCHEKRETYGRSHALRIADMAFEDMVPEDSALLTSLSAEFRPRTKTATVESRLKEEALRAGVVMNLGRAVEAFPPTAGEEEEGADLVVACDGARSVLRAQLVRECGATVPEFAVEKRLGSLLQIKFQALGSIEAGRHNKLSEFADSLAYSSQFFRVLPSKYDPVERRTPITIFSLLLEEVEAISTAEAVDNVEALKAAFASHPKIGRDVKTLLESEFPDGVSKLRVSVLPARYHVASVVTQGQRVLLGDAAMGLPLEKGLGFGWRAANALVRCLASCGSVREALLVYHAHFESLASEAINLVISDFARYQQLVKTASVARTLVNTVSLGLAHSVAASKVRGYRSAPLDVDYECARCARTYRLDSNTGCAHSGAWHSQYGDCGVNCALKLGSKRIGMQHWGCCGATETNGVCSASKHQPK